jgi:hypothetical protein
MSRTQLALDSALELAEQGKTSFPCNWFSKAPTKPKARGGQGYKDATEDPAALRKFWKEFPGGLVGVPTGETNGFDVLDIDPKHAAAREWWSETRDALLPTRAHRTRSGGLHLLFTHAPGIKCSASKIAQGSIFARVEATSFGGRLQDSRSSTTRRSPIFRPGCIDYSYLRHRGILSLTGGSYRSLRVLRRSRRTSFAICAASSSNSARQHRHRAKCCIGYKQADTNLAPVTSDPGLFLQGEQE